MLRFTTTRQAAALHGTKMLVYGVAGVGKTTLAATAPKPLILSAEAGLLSIRDTDIPVIEITDITDLEEAYLFVANNEKADQFETIILDSLSEIGEQVLSAAKKELRDGRAAYGKLVEKMSDIIRDFRNLSGKHVVFTAKLATWTDEVSGITAYYPSMPGNRLTNELPYFFDVVLAMRIGIIPEEAGGGTYRYLQSQPDTQYTAKDRSGRLELVEQPDLTILFKKIGGASLDKQEQPKEESASVEALGETT